MGRKKCSFADKEVLFALGVDEIMTCRAAVIAFKFNFEEDSEELQNAVQKTKIREDQEDAGSKESWGDYIQTEDDDPPFQEVESLSEVENPPVHTE